MVEIPSELMAERVITEALEYGEYGDVYDTASEGEFGEYEYEIDWSLNDLEPEDCDVDVDGNTVVVMGEIEGVYSVQTRSATYNPPGKAHPAEYESHYVDMMVEIRMELDELAAPVINVEPW